MLCVKFVKLVDPFLIFPFLSMFKSPIFEIWYFEIVWMTELLKEKGILFSKIFIFIDQLSNNMCEIRKFWSFLIYFVNFCELIDQMLFHASEWLKETQSYWVWHFLSFENYLNDCTLCVKFVKFVDPFFILSLFTFV